MPDAVELKNVVKVYGSGNQESVTAVDDISLNIRRGEIFSLVGPDGAGKNDRHTYDVRRIACDPGAR